MSVSIRQWAREQPAALALVEAWSGRQRTASELDRRANCLAGLFRQHGLKRGDCVAALMEDRLEIFEFAIAALRAGLYAFVVDTGFDQSAISKIIDDSDAMLVLASARYKEAAVVAASSAKGQPPVIDVDQQFESVLASHSGLPIPDESPGRIAYYSGGTTGSPKGVRHPLPDPEKPLPDPLAGLLQERLAFEPGMVFSTAAGLHNVAPLRFGLLALSVGGTVVLLGPFEPRAALAALTQYRVTHAHWLPHMMTALAKLPAAPQEPAVPASLRCVIHAAASCFPWVKTELMQRWGPIIFEIYSGTEAAGFTMIGPQEWLRKPGSVGRAAIGGLHIMDEYGSPLPSGSIGRVYFSDPQPFIYYKQPERTAAAFNRDGWATIDDMGYIDEEGYLYLIERSQFAQRIGDQFLNPRVSENRLIADPSVADVAVVWRKQDETHYEGLAMVATLQTDAASPDPLLELVADLPDWERPSRILRLAELPRDRDGKVNKALVAHE